MQAWLSWLGVFAAGVLMGYLLANAHDFDNRTADTEPHHGPQGTGEPATLSSGVDRIPEDAASRPKTDAHNAPLVRNAPYSVTDEASTPHAEPTKRPRVQVHVAPHPHVEIAKQLQVYAVSQTAAALRMPQSEYVWNAVWKKRRPSGPTILELPVAGPWFVGATWGSIVCKGQVIHVEEGESRDVTIELPQLGSIQLDLAGEVPDGIDKVSADLSYFTNTVDSDWPGPDQLRHQRHHGDLTSGRRVISTLMAGLEYDVKLQLTGPSSSYDSSARSATIETNKDLELYAAMPSSTTARVGDRVSVTIVRAGGVSFSITYRDLPKELVPYLPTLRLIGKHSCPDIVPPQSGAWTADRTLAPGPWRVVADGPWRVDGPDRIQVRAGTSSRIELAVSLNQRADLRSSIADLIRRAQPMALRLVWPSGLAAPTDREIREFQLGAIGIDRAGHRVVEEFEADESHDVPFGPIHVQQCCFAALPWAVFRADLIDETRLNRTTENGVNIVHAPVVEGGQLIFVPGRHPWISTHGNEYSISMADGGVFPSLFPCEPNEVPYLRLERAYPLQPGTRIGPLPPGTYTFQIWNQGALIAKATARVIAKQIRPLVLESKSSAR